MVKRASRRRIIRAPKVVKVKPISQYARVDADREPRNQFEALRRSLNMTQEQFAEKCGVTKQCIQFYEVDRSFPTVKTWHKMKESASNHGITLNDEILNEFLSKKLLKRKEMIERHHQEKIEKINQQFNEYHDKNSIHSMVNSYHEAKFAEHQESEYGS